MNKTDIIIPTMDNEKFIYPCVRSILANTDCERIGQIIVVNNGRSDSLQKMQEYKNPKVRILDQGQNRGWQGGLQAGLAVSESPFVLFLNDDTFVPPSSASWLGFLISHFDDKKVGATGPCSNSSPGFQDMGLFFDGHVLKVPFLVGFCMLLRRDALDACGGVDSTVPWGDDIDLSFRLRQHGFDLIADRRAFVFHQGGVTGRKLYPDFYDSDKMLEEMSETLSLKYGRNVVNADYKQPRCEVLA